MFIYCKYKVLLALHYLYQYPVFTLSSHVAATTEFCSSSLKLLSCEHNQLCEDESLSFLSLYYYVLYLKLLMPLRPLKYKPFFSKYV